MCVCVYGCIGCVCVYVCVYVRMCVQDTGSVQSPYFDQRAEIDTTVVIKNEAGWLERGRQQIEALELDLLVYVDCLSHKGHTFRLAVGRLARAQACSMGTITR